MSPLFGDPKTARVMCSILITPCFGHPDGRLYAATSFRRAKKGLRGGGPSPRRRGGEGWKAGSNVKTVHSTNSWGLFPH